MRLVLETRTTLFTLDGTQYQVTERRGYPTEVETIHAGDNLPGGGRRVVFLPCPKERAEIIAKGVHNLTFS